MTKSIIVTPEVLRIKIPWISIVLLIVFMQYIVYAWTSTEVKKLRVLIDAQELVDQQRKEVLEKRKNWMQSVENRLDILGAPNSNTFEELNL